MVEQLLWSQWGVLRAGGATIPVLVRDDEAVPTLAAPGATPPSNESRAVVITAPTGGLDRLASLDAARIRMPSGAELTLLEQRRTHSPTGRTGAVFALASET